MDPRQETTNDNARFNSDGTDLPGRLRRTRPPAALRMCSGGRRLRPATSRRMQEMASLLTANQEVLARPKPWDRVLRHRVRRAGPGPARRGHRPDHRGHGDHVPDLRQGDGLGLPGGRERDRRRRSRSMFPASTIAEDRFWTQGLYLDGYGAIFFLPVDFPLAAPPEEQTRAEVRADRAIRCGRRRPMSFAASRRSGPMTPDPSTTHREWRTSRPP